MKKTIRVLAIALMIIFMGCQQSQKEQTTEISRKDRLVGNENLILQNELAKCRGEIESQKRLVEQCLNDNEKDLQKADETYKTLIEETEQLRKQCQEEKDKIIEDTNSTAEWISSELPGELLDKNTQLTEENEKLKARIAELEEKLKQAGIKEQLPSTPNEPPASSPNESSVDPNL